MFVKKIKMRLLTFILLCFLFLFSYSQNSNLEEDKKSIKSMCGCFDVKFNFAETLSYSEDSIYKPSKIKIAGALEWAQLVEEEDNKVVIQHLLVVGSESNPMIIKHWRQDWIFQNTSFYMFSHDRKWNYVELSNNDVSRQWTQKVYQVDDSPRYEGSGSWVPFG